MKTIPKNVAVLILLAGILAISPALPANESEFEYLPPGLKLEPSIPTPQQHLGFKIGERHIQHHQLVSYLRVLARLSPRIKLKIYAYSHGGRPCILLTITSSKNHRRLEQIRTEHLQLADPATADSVDTTKLPAVINMGYSVHGDESSGSNAAAVVAYYLAAAQGKEIEKTLENCVILMDPCLNPDGFNRFASWANGHVGRVQNADPNHVEHTQPFPGGRVNYYWFDLNRDWLPAQHPESRGRLAEYHAWKPNVVLDFHEMGTNSSYFFQPGIPTRNNPLTPARNYELTQKMSLYHAKALDQIGSLYMTEERFDDFYMGKGSTYPDLHGSVGILFEQASSRGHRQESINGELTFPFTIRNQVTTSLSSLDATVDMRESLLKFKRQFYDQSLIEATEFGHDHFEFRCDHDKSRLMSFAKVLLRHDLDVFEHASEKGTKLVVPVKQPEFRFLLSLTEKRTDFRENIFYDVSTWHLPSAFHVESSLQNSKIPAAKLKRLSISDLENAKPASAMKKVPEKALAYVIDWRSSAAPELVFDLLRMDVKVRVAQKPFSIKTDGKVIDFEHGTIMIPLGIQKDKAQLIHSRVNMSDAPLFRVESGLTPVGIDLGSGRFAPIRKPTVAMLVGNGVSRYEAGEIWHLFDTRLKHPITMIDTSRLSRARLDRYSTLILVSGSYSSLGDRQVEQIREWVQKGGNLVLCGSACTWARSRKLANLELVEGGSPEALQSDAKESLSKEPLNDSSAKSSTKKLQKPFDQARNDAALKLISGAIFETNVDTTHPLGYGISPPQLPVFRNNRVIIKPSQNAYQNAVLYTADPQVAGYCSQENVNLLKNSAAAIVTTEDSGTIILIPQNPNFRAFWYGTNRLFHNAILFGNLAGN